MILSEQIKRGRKQLAMSQSDLADAIWVSRNTISNWESGATTPDIQSLVLMSALFGITLDQMVKDDDQVMAQAFARDRSHILLASSLIDTGRGARAVGDGCDSEATVANGASGESIEGGDERLDLFSLRSLGNPSYGRFENADITDASGLAYRLVRAASFFSRQLYRIIDEDGGSVGSIARKHALHHPVFQVRMDGFDRVQLRREVRIDNGYKDVVRIDGEDVGVEGNLMGDNFAVTRKGSVTARVHVQPALNRVAYGIELVDHNAAPLSLGVVLAIMMLRDYDRVWVRGAGARTGLA